MTEPTDHAGAVLDDAGRPFKVVKFASDITAEKLKAANYAGQIDAMNLGRVGGRQRAVFVLGPEADANARGRSARAAGALRGGGLADPFQLQAV